MGLSLVTICNADLKVSKMNKTAALIPHEISLKYWYYIFQSSTGLCSFYNVELI